MSKKLWQKNAISLHPLVESYTVGDDYVYDNQLIEYDIIASRAHAWGLWKIGILTKVELNAIEGVLKQLTAQIKAGKFKVTLSDEDCHTAIENFLVKKLGTVGKKIHTGRSRNDQVLTAIRLYSLDQLNIMFDRVKSLAGEFLLAAKKYQTVVMPGYSHTQQAMISTVGHYLSALAESLINDAEVIKFTQNFVSQSPLGSAAGFGVSLNLPRKATARLAGFKKVQINSLYCQNSRGKYESLCLEALSQTMLTLGKFANDLVLFTSREFDFFHFPDALVTGSSIMPQKRNLDAMEIMRAQTKVVIGNQDLIKNICQGLPSGYNRDLQLIKKPLFDSFKIVLASLEVTQLYLKNLQVNEKKLLEKIKIDIVSADLATKSALSGVPFRDAYLQAKQQLDNQADEASIDWSANLKSKISLGSPGNLALNILAAKLKKL